MAASRHSLSRLLAMTASALVLGLAPGFTSRADAQSAPDPVATAEATILPAPIAGDDDAAPDDPPAGRGDATTWEPLDETVSASQRAVVRDGDLSYPPEPRAPRDGDVAPVEPQPVRDGGNSIALDNRPASDIAAFESPPAGYDPLLFQIEDLPPVEDRRIRRLFAAEPYDPVGIRIGSFVLFPEAEIGTRWTSNVRRSADAQPDYALDIRPTARIVSDWRRHALEFRAASTLSYFSEFDSENDEGYALEARGRLDLTRRTNLQGFIARELAQEARSAIDANASGERADVTVDRAGATLNHRFNRHSLQLRGTVGDYRYSDVAVGGAIDNNDDRNYTSYEEAVRASWEFKPTLTGFVEVAVNQRRYDTAAQSDGILRNSNGERYRAGLAFGNSGKILRGEIALGYGIQTPEDDRLEAVDGIILDANVAWRLSQLTTLAFNARSDVAETTTTGVGGVFTRSAGIEARHAFRRHLIGTAGITYTTQDYAGSSLEENELRGDLGLEYFLSREAILFSRYRHTSFGSSAAGADYAADEFHIGMRLRR